jgi:hypothetical protein
MILDDLFEAMKPSDIPTVMRTNRLTMRDIEKERPQGAYRFTVGDKEFMDLDAAREFARGTGETVKPIRETQKKSLDSRIQHIQKTLDEYRTKKKSQEPQDNFTADDIKRLETISDLETLKAQAKQLIKGKPARRMKPEKIAYFYDKIDDMPGRLQIIKLMYDLLLSGEGHQVLGTKWSTDPNTYRRRFGEGLNVARDENENIILDEAGKDACYNKVRSRYKVWPSAYASGALVQCRKKGAANWGTGGKKK